jgi:hypothetical protein
MKKAFDGLTSKLGTAELEAILIETSKTKKQREQKLKNTEENIQ